MLAACKQTRLGQTSDPLPSSWPVSVPSDMLFDAPTHVLVVGVSSSPSLNQSSASRNQLSMIAVHGGLFAMNCLSLPVLPPPSRHPTSVDCTQSPLSDSSSSTQLIHLPVVQIDVPHPPSIFHLRSFFYWPSFSHLYAALIPKKSFDALSGSLRPWIRQNSKAAAMKTLKLIRAHMSLPTTDREPILQTLASIRGLCDTMRTLGVKNPLLWSNMSSFWSVCWQVLSEKDGRMFGDIAARLTLSSVDQAIPH